MSVSDHPELVSALLAVEGVAGAAVETDEQASGPGTLRLQLQPGADEVSVAAQVNQLLRTRFGLAVDAGRVRVFDRPSDDDGSSFDADLDPAGARTGGGSGTGEGGPDDGDNGGSAESAPDEGAEPDHADDTGDTGDTDDTDGRDATEVAGDDGDDRADSDPSPMRGRAVVGTWPSTAGADAPTAVAATSGGAGGSATGVAATGGAATGGSATGTERKPSSRSDEPAPAPAPAGDAGDAGGPATATLPFVRVTGPGRLSIERVQMVTAGLGVAATVTLALGDTAYSGESDGVGTTAAVHRTVATATLRALEKVLDGRVRFDLEHLEVAATGDDRTVLVVVTLVSTRGDERLSGASVVREDARQAVIRAVLAAVNRRIEPMLDGA